MSSLSNDNSVLFAHAPGPFTEAELDAIERYGDGLETIKAPLGGDAQGGQYDAKRKTQVASVAHNAETAWIYDRITKAVLTINSGVYNFDLTGFRELFQYMVYRGEEASHFDWHTDQNRFTAPRKLSLTVQLSEPSAYEGCDLQFYDGNTIESAPRARGTLIAFPAYVLHRVTPILSGTRKSIVAWTAGPKFR